MEQRDANYEIIISRKGLPIVFENRPYLAEFPHLHKEIEIVYIKQGSCEAYVNQRKYEMHAGDLMIAYPHQIHYYLNVPRGEYLLLIFNTDFLLEMEPEIHENILVDNVLHIGTDSDIAKDIQDIIAIDGKYVHSKVRYSIGLIMAKLLPLLHIKPIPKSANLTVSSVLEYCQNHYTEDISLSLLAEKLHLNKNYISHIINTHTNMSLTDFVNSMRIHAASMELRTTDKKILEIAQEVGFSSLRSFNRAFLTYGKMTPTEYRKQFKVT
ncbi:MAG: helix-turn-helix transcriptional regulator [Clostridia bacterium]|nr:helix-turn-helix transcriptional regulator [Clostridia bacterium]